MQKRPKERYSDRDSPDYDGKDPDVLNVKLDFLLSLTQVAYSSPRHPDDSASRVDGDGDDDDDLKASNKGDTGFESLFPSLLSFLDLSTLNLKKIASVPLTFATFTS